MFDAEIHPTQSTWTTRSEYWSAQCPLFAKPRRKRQRSTTPLVLCGHGVTLKIDGATLLVRNGRTHYPHDPETYRFFPGSLDLPPRIIVLDGSGYVSFDVLSWLAEQRIPLIRIDWRGEVQTVIGGSGFAAETNKVRWQLETRSDLSRRMAFSIDLIKRKIDASIDTLEHALPCGSPQDRALTRLRENAAELADRAPTTIDALRGIEGRASAAYFSTWKGIELKFQRDSRRPIPTDWLQYDSRSSHYPGKLPKNEKATHPLNAILNYAYAVLQARVQIEAVAQGYDPTVGIMHHGYRGNPAYAFDLMEPERPRVDAAVLAFAQGEIFSPADFVIRSDGVVRLSPQLARRVVTSI